MPFGAFGPPPAEGTVGEFGTVAFRVEGNDVGVVKEYTIASHFLTPSDSFRFVIGDDKLTDEIRSTFFVGAKVEVLIDGAKQMTGYIYVVDCTTDRNGGTSFTIEGRDTMSMVVDTQIDPDHHYPDKTPLDKLIRDILEPFGFTSFDISNEANVDVAANRALKQKHGARRVKHHRHKVAAPKALKQYALPKTKPQHNDSFYLFLSRILNRYGLWIWPTVDGDGIIVGKPNYDQDPAYELRRLRSPSMAGFGRAAGVAAETGQNNVMHGGIRQDGSEQPSFIVARGNIPPRTVSHSKIQVVIDNPLRPTPADVLKTAFQTSRSQGGLNNETGSFARATPEINPNKAFLLSRSAGTLRNESGTYSEAAAGIHEKLFTSTQKIAAPPVEIPNKFAPKFARPRYLKDPHSRTIEELTGFAKRQMSLCVRKAFVAKYTVAGLRVDGEIPQVDTVISVNDEVAGFSGLLWVQARTISQSRGSGSTVEIEAIPLHALEF